MKKKFLFLTVVILLFSGCGGTDYYPEITDPEYCPYATVITIAWWGTSLRHERTNAVLRMFEEQNPGIRFVAEYFDFDGYFTNLRARILAGDVWDIFQLGSNYPDFIADILPLNDLIAGGIIDTSGIADEFLYLTTSGEDVVGISLGVNAWGIAYDPAMFRQAGVPMPYPHWTWENFSTAALAISNHHNVWGVGSFPQEGIALTQYLSMKGIPFFDSADITRLNIESHEPMVSFLEMMATLVQRGAKPGPRDVLHIPTVEHDPLVFSGAGMAYIASNQFIALSNAALAIDPGRELAMGMLPGDVFGGSGALVSSQMFSVFNGSEHAEYAARFICFFVNDRDANLVLMGERGVPITSTARDAIEDGDCSASAAVSAFISDVAYVRENLELAATATPVLANPARGRIENEMSNITELVVLGMMSPEEGAIAIFEFATQAVAEN